MRLTRRLLKAGMRRSLMALTRRRAVAITWIVIRTRVYFDRDMRQPRDPVETTLVDLWRLRSI
jgi:hypothetical protein